MLNSKKSRKGAIGAAVLAGVLAVSGYALTDVLGVPADSHAGDGTEAIENVVATNVHYTLNGTDPSVVDSIEFALAPGVASGGAVWVQPVSTGATITAGSTAGAWYSCDITTVTAPVCATTGAATPLAAADIDQVRVVAAD